MELKKFDDEMWYGFAGCNSDEPLWGELETENEDWLIIVDDKHVECNQLIYPIGTGRESDVWNEAIWHQEFSNKILAKAFAESLTPEMVNDLTIFDFKCIHQETRWITH